MSVAQLLPFVLASLLCIVAPGPDNISVLSYGISCGRRAGILFAVGCAAGCLLHTFWLAIGLSAIVAASVTAFTVLKTIGALYLFYLSYRAFRSTGLIRLRETTASDAGLRAIVFFRRGFLANALNPKVALFFLAFLPQFTHPGDLSLPVQFLLLGSLFAVLSLLVFSVIGAAAGAVGGFLKNHSGLGLWLDRITGAVFLTLGVLLLVSQAKRKI